MMSSDVIPSEAPTSRITGAPANSSDDRIRRLRGKRTFRVVLNVVANLSVETASENSTSCKSLFESTPGSVAEGSRAVRAFGQNARLSLIGARTVVHLGVQAFVLLHDGLQRKMVDD